MNDFRRKNILILAEGFEEKPYIDKMLSFPNINKRIYHFADSVNVKGNGNIVARYQFEMQRGFYDVVLIFCDADKGSDEFHDIVAKIGQSFFKNKDDGVKVFIFSNPVTLQIVLSHFGDVKLNKVSKKSNAEIVERLTGIRSYDAKKEQIEEMIGKIRFVSLDKWKQRISTLSTNWKDVPSTNFLQFLERFESEDSTWVEDIRKALK